ncbi:MAG TPA: hypothetical protein VGP72_12165 [Planctomycetota bacterium]|jgi:tetratricopeptide (TPR) repeat protein
MEKPGYYKGKHYTEYVDEVARLQSESRDAEAEQLLLALIDATEAEDRVNQWGVAPWYYNSLAGLYEVNDRRQDAITVLERFARQRHARGCQPAELLAYLEELKDERPVEVRLIERGSDMQLFGLAQERIAEKPPGSMSLSERLDVLDLLRHALDRASDKYPKSKAQILRLIGEVELAVANKSQALDYFRQALAMDPSVGLKKMARKLEAELRSANSGN